MLQVQNCFSQTYTIKATVIGGCNHALDCIEFICHLSKKCNYIYTSLLKPVLIKITMCVMKNILLHILTYATRFPRIRRRW